MGPLRSDVEGVERLPQHAGMVVLDVLGGVDQHDGARLRIGGGLEQPARSIGIRQLAQVVLPKLLEVQFTGMEGLAEQIGRASCRERVERAAGAGAAGRGGGDTARGRRRSSKAADRPVRAQGWCDVSVFIRQKTAYELAT